MMLTLYKGLNFDGVNSFPNITNQATFDTYLTGKEEYSQSIIYNRIGDPILINTDYDTAVSYGYGCIDTGTKKYFIIPDSISVNENNRVYLQYSVDWYTTLKYDNAISFGRSHLIKSTGTDPNTYSQSIQPIDMRVSQGNKLERSVTGSICDYNQEIVIVYTRPEDMGGIRWAISPLMDGASVSLQSTFDKTTIDVDDITSGLFLKVLDVPADNIIAVFFVPMALHNINDGSLGFGSFDYMYEEGHYKTLFSTTYTNINSKQPVTPDGTFSNISTNSTKMGVVMAPTGDIIHTVPYGRSLVGVKMQFFASVSQAYVKLLFNYGGGVEDELKHAENSSAYYICDRIDYVSDAYANWSFGMKGIEIEERRLQKNKALVSNLTNVATTTAIGMGAGGPGGAAVGAVGGFVGAISSYAIDTYYESDVNALEDRKYQLAQDTVVPGSFIGPNFLYTVQLTAPPSDIARYNTELANFGADCNIPLSQWTPSPGAYKFADVEIIADVPYSIKQNIRNKLISGIKIVDVT